MQMAGYEKLGYFSIAVLYGFIGIGCLISTSLMNKIGAQNSMIIGSLCDFTWILCSIIPIL